MLTPMANHSSKLLDFLLIILCSTTYVVPRSITGLIALNWANGKLASQKNMPMMLNLSDFNGKRDFAGVAG
jgi:hypothetical protein